MLNINNKNKVKVHKLLRKPYKVNIKQQRNSRLQDTKVSNNHKTIAVTNNNENNSSLEEKPRYSGFIYLIFKKRNIFCTATDKINRIRSTVSSGILKFKGRKRQSLHVVRKTGKILIGQLFKYHLIKLTLIYRARRVRNLKRKKTAFFQIFSNITSLQFKQIYHFRPKNHNGCRPRKIRRK